MSPMRRCAAAISAMLLILAIVISVPIVSASAAAFTARTSKPGSGNDYYFSSKNAFYSMGYTGACTWYGYGRAYEILGEKPKLSLNSAPGWYAYNKENGYYAYGSTPKVSAVMVTRRSDGSGHIAIVESIKGSTMTVSEYNWNVENGFGTRTLSTSVKTMGRHTVLGYIYLLDETPEETPSEKLLPGKYRVYDASSLNIREGAGTNYDRIGSIPGDEKVQVSGFNSDQSWAKVTYDGVTGWVSMDYLKLVSVNTLTIRFITSGGDVGNSDYDVNDDGYIVSAQNHSKYYSQVWKYGEIKPYGLVDVNSSTFQIEKEGYYAPSGAEWYRTANGKTVTFDQSDNMLSAQELAKKAGLDLSKNSYTITLGVNWEKDAAPVIDFPSDDPIFDNVDSIINVGLNDAVPTGIFGDANNDGNVNAIDVMYIRRYIAELPVQMIEEAADVDCNEKITAIDLMLVRQYIAEIIPALGVSDTPSETPSDQEAPETTAVAETTTVTSLEI